jgi:hypothetical protein
LNLIIFRFNAGLSAGNGWHITINLDDGLQVFQSRLPHLLRQHAGSSERVELVSIYGQAGGGSHQNVGQKTVLNRIAGDGNIAMRAGGRQPASWLPVISPWLALMIMPRERLKPNWQSLTAKPLPMRLAAQKTRPVRQGKFPDKKNSPRKRIVVSCRA